MNKWIVIIVLCISSLLQSMVLDLHKEQIQALQSQVNHLTIEQMQLNRQVRELWEAEEKLLWVSQDIDRRLIEVGR